MCEQSILVTGSAGLVGRAVVRLLQQKKICVIPFDNRDSGCTTCDLRFEDSLSASIRKATGIIHLAAISRVLAGEQDPALCWDVNVLGTRRVLDLAMRSAQRPWVIFASSREVYGQQRDLPVCETAALQPINTYGRSKLAGEQLVELARDTGLRTATLRFSNVYGDIWDYEDRVVPAFARAAASGGVLRLEGAETSLDFTQVDDAAEGVLRAAELVRDGGDIPAINLASGTATKLKDLATFAMDAGATQARVIEGPARGFDVRHFCADPSRAASLLDWRSKIAIKDGMKALVDAFRNRLSQKE